MKYSTKIKIINWVCRVLKMNQEIQINDVFTAINQVKVSSRIPVGYIETHQEQVIENLAIALGREIIKSNLAEKNIIKGLALPFEPYNKEDMADVHLQCFVVNPKKI